jgi:hypothetical protein
LPRSRLFLQREGTFIFSTFRNKVNKGKFMAIGGPIGGYGYNYSSQRGLLPSQQSISTWNPYTLSGSTGATAGTNLPVLSNEINALYRNAQTAQIRRVFPVLRGWRNKVRR